MGRNVFSADVAVQSDAREDGELGARVQAVDIFRRIGLGEAKLLRLPKSGGEGNGGALDLAENVVAGAVEKPAYLKEFTPGQAFMQPGNPGHAARHGGAKLDLLIHPPRQGDQLR